MGPSFLVRAALILLISGAAIVTPTDADLWGHLRFGRDILASGTPVQVDTYSFTTDKPWVNHEWLAEVVFSAIYGGGGSTGLIAFKLAVIAALLLCVWRHVRHFAGPQLSWLLVTATFVGTYWRTHNVRPQLFSILLFAITLLCITSADAGRRRLLWFVPPIFLLWTNLHGGWIVGFAVYGLWAAARLVGRSESQRDRVLPVLVAFVAVVVTLANPWGLQLWSFLTDTVRPTRADIEEWISITQYPLVLGIPWAFTLLAVAAALWRGGLPRRLDYLAVIGALALLAFLVGRLDAFFVLAVVILLAPQLAKLWDESVASSPQRQPLGIVAITVVGTLALAVPVSRFAAPYATCLPISGDWAPDARAGRFISESHLSGRMLAWFDWGEYAIWHFGPALQVSMDGRRETVYTERTIQAHRRFYAGDDTAMPYLQQLNPDFVWLPTHLPVAKQIEGAGWIQVFNSGVSSIWARSPMTPRVENTLDQGLDASRCFPGP